MAAILASQSCYCLNNDLMNHGRMMDNLSFSSSVSDFQRQKCSSSTTSTTTNQSLRLQVDMRQTDLPPKIGLNGRPVVKMVPATEVMKRKPLSKGKVETVNGTKQNVNAATLVKRNSSSALVRSPEGRDSKELPPIEELKVLPSDENFSWANENYSSWQRSADVWSFVISFRLRVLLDNAKWAYVGGFSEDKQKNRRRKTASWLRERVLQLGPTFIKLGQLSSTRSDLFPREFVDELAKLQDRVPAFSPEKAKRFFERELGAPIGK